MARGKDPRKAGFNPSKGNPNQLGNNKAFSPDATENQAIDKRGMHYLAHQSSDVDSGPEALHHRLGFGQGMAAPGSELWFLIRQLYRKPDILIQTIGGISPFTWEKPFRARLIEITTIGGGGGGGAAPDTAAGEVAEGAGGGGGGSATRWISANDIPDEVEFNLPTGGGSGGTPISLDGNDGGTVVFGQPGDAWYTRATGGGGGSGGNATSGTNRNLGGIGGDGTDGDILLHGGDGGNSVVAGGSITIQSYGGAGAGNYGGTPRRPSGLNNPGNVGYLYGGGGTGANNGFSQSARSGGNGARPALIIVSFF